MTYTRTWNTAYENTPAGPDQLSQGDDRIRDFKVDVRQRMDSIVKNWQADPVELNDAVTGVQQNKQLYIPGIAFRPDSNVNGVVSIYGELYFINQSTDYNAYAAVILPTTAVVKSLGAVWVMSVPGGAHNVSFGYQAWSTTEAFTQVATINATATSVVSAAVSHTIAPDRLYFIRAFWPDISYNSFSNRLLGVRLLYDVLNAQALR